MICPYCKRLIHPDSFSCVHCGSFVRDYSANRGLAANPSPAASAWSLANEPPVQTDPHSAFEREKEALTQQAGDDAEARLVSRFTIYSQDKAMRVFARKRIPVGKQHREIDLLVVSPKRLYIFEIKNWTGRLALQGNTWVQIRRTGQRRKCDDLLATARAQAQALLQFLAVKEIVISPRVISHKVIFVNPGLEIDSVIADHPDVIHSRKLADPTEPKAIIDYCLDRDRGDLVSGLPLEQQARELFASILDELHRLRTWDRVFLHGAGCEKGDVKEIRVGNVVCFQSEFVVGSSIQVQWPHDDPDLVLQQTLLGLKPGRLALKEGSTLAIDADDYILFHKVGQAEPTVIPLATIDKISIG